MSNRSAKIKLLGVDFSDPYNIKTFSGSSYFIWTKFKEKASLVDAFAPYPSKWVTNYYKLLSFHPNHQQWRANWHSSIGFRKCLSRRAVKRINQYPPNAFNATVQVGAYFDISGGWPGYKALIADNNCVIAQKTNINYQATAKYFKKLFAFEKKVYDSMDRIFSFSQFLADSFVNDFGCPENKVSVIYAGINIDEKRLFASDKSYESKAVLFSAFDFKNKGGEILLGAFEKVRKEIPGARIIMIGPSVSDLPDYVTSYGFLSKTDPDQLEKIYEVYKEASIFVLPTLADAFPNVIREGMAARLPCVASNISSIPEMIEDGVTGYLIPKGDENALAEKLIVLLKDAGLCRKMGEAGYERQQRLFRWDTVCDKMLSEIADGLSS